MAVRKTRTKRQPTQKVVIVEEPKGVEAKEVVLTDKEQETKLKQEVGDLLNKTHDKVEELLIVQRKMKSSGFRLFSIVKRALFRNIKTLTKQKLINTQDAKSTVK